MEKATFRLPEWEMERLRQWSKRQGRSLNAVVIDVIARGLGEEPEHDEVLRALGPMVVRPPLRPYVPLSSGDRVEGARLGEALDWSRGDR